MKIREVIATLNRMTASGVIERYAVGGAVGATFYLEAVATFDVDVFVSIALAPQSHLIVLSPIYDYLAGQGHAAEGEHIVIAGWPVQFLPAANPLISEAIAAARVFDVEGEAATVFSAEHLLAIALQTGRAKDRARILDFIHSKALDAATLTSIITRHGLDEPWRRYKAVFGDRP